MSTIETLIDESIAKAAAGSSWLGSSEQLEFLNATLPGLDVEDAQVVWAPAMRPANWERATRTIQIERIPSGSIPRSDEVIATMTARTLMHESLHARYSTESVLERRVMQGDPRLAMTTRMIGNFLEDARVAKLAIADDPELSGPIADHMDDAVDQLDARSGRSGSGSEPPDQRTQLVFAIMAYILTPDRDVELHPDVRSELDQFRSIINAARDGATTDATVGVAFDVVDRAMRFPPPQPQ